MLVPYYSICRSNGFSSSCLVVQCRSLLSSATIILVLSEAKGLQYWDVLRFFFLDLRECSNKMLVAAAHLSPLLIKTNSLSTILFPKPTRVGFEMLRSFSWAEHFGYIRAFSSPTSPYSVFSQRNFPSTITSLTFFCVLFLLKMFFDWCWFVK